MFPFTNAATCPNIGFTTMRASFGTSDLKKVSVPASFFGIFIDANTGCPDMNYWHPLD